MPPAFEVLLLNTAVPQIQAAQSGDTYVVPRDIAFSAVANLANGTNLLPSLTFSSDTNTGIYREGADALGFTAGGGTNQMVLTSTGLGIGTNNPGSRLDVRSGATTFTAQLSSTGTNTYAATASTSLTNTMLQLIGGGASGATTGIRLSQLGSFELYFGGVQESGGAGAFVWQGYSGSAYAERMRLDSSGNLGLGVTPKTDWNADYDAFQLGAGSSLSGHTSTSLNFTVLASNQYVNTAGTSKFINDGYAPRYLQRGDTGEHYWYTTNNGLANGNVANTQAMTLLANGNLGIGNTSPVTTLSIGASAGSGGYNGGVYLNRGSSSYNFYEASDGTNNIIFGLDNTLSVAKIGSVNSYPIGFFTGNIERARITSGGYFKASNSGTYIGSTGAYHELVSNEGSGTAAVYIRNTNATSPAGIDLSYSAASPNGTGNTFLYCQDSTALRASIRSNGGLANYQSNNVDLSDIRTKTDISPLASYWNKIAALEIVTYKYKDQTHDDLNIGVIAQQVEQVAPEFVDADGFSETPEDGVPLKTIYNKDLTFAAIKALQEAMTRIEKLEAEVAALKGA